MIFFAWYISESRHRSYCDVSDGLVRSKIGKIGGESKQVLNNKQIFEPGGFGRKKMELKYTTQCHVRGKMVQKSWNINNILYCSQADRNLLLWDFFNQTYMLNF